MVAACMAGFTVLLLHGRGYCITANVREAMQANVAAVHLWETSWAGDAATSSDTAEWPPCTVQLSIQDRQPTARGHILSNSSSAHPGATHPQPRPCKHRRQMLLQLIEVAVRQYGVSGIKVQTCRALCAGNVLPLRHYI